MRRLTLECAGALTAEKLAQLIFHPAIAARFVTIAFRREGHLLAIDMLADADLHHTGSDGLHHVGQRMRTAARRQWCELRRNNGLCHPAAFINCECPRGAERSTAREQQGGQGGTRGHMIVRFHGLARPSEMISGRCYSGSI
ncbi:hypothetical protein [Sphingomonas sp.]|uniref:hypothetical protein n=1 Tax=Sphingomonas sp. TaxID=28214 RepID=UPI003B008306